MIRALIVEDIPLVRKGIRLFLEEERDIEIVGEACDGPDAVAQIAALQPDLVFLDVQMPGFDGFEVLERSKERRPKAVIFITAHGDYALRAFDHDAVSYLLKPIDPRRFTEVLQRARSALLQSSSPTPDKRLTRLVVKQGDHFRLIPTQDVDWIAATGEYSRLHTRQGAWLLRIALSELAERLDPEQFTRIHRCTIVNLDRIREIQPRSHGDCDVLLQDGNTLRMSRSYRDIVLARGT
jgi:two-component system LytT family response regulator